MAFLRKEDDGCEDLNIDTHSDAPARYVSLDRVYSAAASLCVSSSNVMSKKVKARKLILKGDGEPEPPLLKVYSRRPKSHKQCADVEAKDHDDESLQKNPKRRRLGCSELVKLGVDSTVLSVLDKPRLRDCRNNCNVENGSPKKRKRKYTKNSTLSGPPDKKHWVVLNLEGADPKALIGLRCQVFWPLDADWYSGKVVGYNAETNRHHVQYEDGDTENLIICNEKIRFHISKEELEKLNLKLSDNCDNNDSEDMVVMAASLDDCQEFEAGDIVWAKLTGHAMWPAIIVDEAVIRDRPGLSKISGERSVLVQFFGTHDFARIKVKQVMSFLNGLLSSFHQKCKKQNFVRSIQEAKIYLSEQRLPKRMRLLQKGVNASGTDSYSSDDERSSDADEPHMKSSLSQRSEKINGESPFVTEGLQILSLGKIVNDSDHFRDDRFVWPEGYTALRKFTSLTDPNGCSLYKMEVLRDPQLKNRPLFRVTLDSGEQIEGSNPSACWNKIYKRIRGMRNNTSDGAELEAQGGYLSGSDMFGFCNPDIVKLMKGLTKSKLHSEISTRKGISGRNRDLSVGYRPVRVDWKDLDKCSVCHMDEEYENNLFLQCDKCRMMVHARCYGEHESVDGVLWLCNLCRPGAPESPPPCCLCPVIGGALKPTTDSRWAHLACAIWIPETCLSDIKRMEPIDGIDRISKDRWKLLCSICGVYYGACIQCSNSSCRVAYHPLCARAAGLCVELEDEDRFLLLSVDDDDTEDQCIRLLSFCKRHRQPSNERSTTDEVICRTVRQCSDYSPPLNPSGCARSEPYNHIGRRGRKEPEALSAASLKRLFVENRPHVVAGHSHHGLSGNMLPLKRVNGLKFTISFHGIKGFQDDTLHNILSVAEKYKYMRETFRKRLVFGKSGIHGFGIFAKHPHRAGDMVIEYTGELVRPSIADRREHLIYNSLVGAGTYMFRIDDERVIDATRAGSIAHLINHSCEPNCYSRVICVNGDNHIIIFAKRDIKRWEELTYDYRFFSIDEHLACYCGFPRCRGVVNDTEAGERLARINVPRSELVDWTGE